MKINKIKYCIYFIFIFFINSQINGPWDEAKSKFVLF